MRQHSTGAAGLPLTAPGGLLTQLARPVPQTARRSRGRPAARISLTSPLPPPAAAGPRPASPGTLLATGLALAEASQ
jgi:hypothetical protein